MRVRCGLLLTVAEYCDECVCLSVCEHIYRTTRPIFSMCWCMLAMWVARSSMASRLAADFSCSSYGRGQIPFPSSPHLPSSPLPLKVGPLSPAGSLGKRCKIAHYGLGRSPSRQTIWCILDSKTAALHKCPRQFMLIFLRKNVIFCTKTSLISYGRYNSSGEGKMEVRGGANPSS